MDSSLHSSIEQQLSRTATGNPSTRFLWGLLLLAFAIQIPLFVCMPLTSDTVLYDIEARKLVEGGVLYRDYFEANLPGIVWVHVFVRAIIGDSSEAMRGFDLLMVGGIMALLGSWCVRLTANPRRALLMALTLFLFYTSLNAWCHCQRDTWMFLPALAAIGLRWRQMQRLASGEAPDREVFLWSIVEGFIWASAFWLKPFISIPAIACWLASSTRSSVRRQLAYDLSGILVGGGIIGAAGTLWLMATGAWPHFWEIVSEWNPRYLEAGRERKTADRLIGMVLRFRPWMMLHLVAIPIAIKQIWLGIRDRRTSASSDDLRMLLSAGYLAWIFQSFTFQHYFDYVHVPELMLAIAILFCRRTDSASAGLEKVALAGFAFLVLLLSPAFRVDRIQNWADCIRNGSSATIRDSLAYSPVPNFEELEPVRGFLSDQDVSDGEVTCFNVHLIHLYEQLEIEPSTRFIQFWAYVELFPDQVEFLQQQLSESHQRFVVSDMVESGLTVEEATAIRDENPQLPPPAFDPPEDSFPWSMPIVFRSGRYLVHQVKGPVGRPVSKLAQR